MSTAPAPFHVMTKPIGPRCNIDCSYCYYLEKERLYPDTGKFRMAPELLEHYIRDYIAAWADTGAEEVSFYWHGGEPTILGVEYFHNILALQDKYKPGGVEIINSIQTNGVLLDQEWARFFKDNRFLVGLSLDGPKKHHDRYRCTRAGGGTFDDVMRGLEFLQKAGVEYNVLCVVHRSNALKPKEVYEFLRGQGIEFIQFVPIVERLVSADHLSPPPQLDDPETDIPVTPWSVSARAYGKFLCDVFDIWVKRDVGKVFVQLFDVQLGLWMGQPSTLCIFGKDCSRALALEHNGDLYSCDHYVYPEYRLGNIESTPITEMVHSRRQIAFGQEKLGALTAQCRSCKYLFACNGGCPKHRFLQSRDGEDGLDYFCASHMQFYRHAGPKLMEMAELLRRGQPAAMIMQKGRKGR